LLSYCKKYCEIFNKAYFKSVNINDFYTALRFNAMLYGTYVIINNVEAEYLYSKIIMGLKVDSNAIKSDIAIYNNGEYARLLMSKMDR